MLLPILLLAQPAKAQTFGDSFANIIETMHSGLDSLWPDALEVEGLTFRAGLGAGIIPDYVGADDYGFRVLPLLEIRYGERLRIDGGMLTYAAIKEGNFEAGPLLNLAFGRSADRNPILRGIRDIDTVFETGAFARYRTRAGLASIDFRQALGDGLGQSVRLTAGHGIYQKEKFAAIAAVRARWLSNKGMQRNFGITQEDAATSEFGLPAFEARSGVSDVNLNVIGSYQLSDRARFLGLVSVGHLFGDAADSPLVQGPNGSTFQTTVGFGFMTQF
ncbi:MAG: MipA/OmpV family protein [Kordiimonadaceae bacterium]|nr:MipA/OmpV family protein [Kordiimonadaceae bacterium]